MTTRRRSVAIAWFYTLLVFMNQFCLITMETATKKEYVFNPEHMGLLYHRASSNVLLHGKAKKELANLPKTETILFNECANASKNVLQLAKCVSVVLDTRDRLKTHELKPEDPECVPDESDGNWVMSMIRAAYQPNLNNRRFTWRQRHIQKLNETSSPHNSLKIDKLPHSNHLFQQKPKGSQFFKNVMHQIQIKKLPLRRMHKRDIRGISPRCLVPKNVEMLRTVRQQFEKLNHVVKYMYDVTKSNQKFFESVDMKVEYRDRIPSKHSPLVQAREFAEKIESFEDRDIVSILSPKLLNLMPETLADPESKRWLSPNMLSFQDEGMLPLPRLFQMSTSDHCETMRWIDLLMDLSGAKRMFNETSGIFGKFMNEVEEIMHPRIKQLEVHDGKFEHIQRLSSGDQQKQMAEHGYTVMNEEQMQIVYGKEGILASPNGTEFKQNEDFEQLFENEIKILGKMTEKDFLKAHNAYHQHVQKRKKRQVPNILDTLLPMTDQPQFFFIRVLDPFAFTARIRNANVMGPYILSPFAFYLQIISPTLLHMEILSPRAFIATIFSPLTLTVRVLAPSAFRLMLFSPVTLVAWIMVPEAFLAKIFSPKLLNVRVMSPETFSAIILSPIAGNVRALSPNTMNLLVLSPSFGTYQLFSGNRHVIQVLSPGILGVDSQPFLREPFRA